MRNNFPLHFVLVVLILASCSVVPAAGSDDHGGASEQADAAERSHVVAYYFHGTYRCATCRKLESYSEEAITEGFADQLASGRLVWKTVNTDEAEHEHFVEDFALVTKSVVLVEYRDGAVVRFENLPKIWQKVRDKDEYLEYVRDATRQFIEHG